MLQSANTHGQNTITVDDKGIIVITIRGKQTVESSRELGDTLSKLSRSFKEKGKPVLIFTNVSGMMLSSTTRASRQNLRSMMKTIPFDKSAVYGNGTLLAFISYLARITGTNRRIHFFNSKSKAMHWLLVGYQRSTRPLPTLLAGIIIALIGIAALIGWQTNNQYLIQWMPSLRPINPLSAVALIVTGVATATYWAGTIKVLRWAGLGALILGVAALLPLHIDYLLYGGRMTAYGEHVNVADSAAVCFIAMGIVGLIANRKGKWVRPVEYVAATVLVLLALLNIFGQLYARETLYSINNSFVMAFNLAVAFVIAGVVLFLTVIYRQSGRNVLLNISRIGWLVMAVLIMVQIATYGMWTQAIAHNEAGASNTFMIDAHTLDDTLSGRFTAYINALYGFQGLFLASNSVGQGEFETYYNTTNVAKHYPGLLAVYFISKVNTSDLATFTKERQADTSLHAGGNPKFAITQLSKDSTHYIVTYVANSQSTGGTDLGSNPSRLAAFQKAEARQQPTASGTVKFTGSTSGTGFFITVPVAYESDPTKTIGFVNAAFNYHNFFADTFGDATLSKGLSVKITDTYDDKAVYDVPLPKGDKPGFVYDVPLSVADRTWTLQVTAPAWFGNTQSSLPKAILIGGQAFSVLLIVIFWMQARGRREALNLAEEITHDLREERNRAIANDQKSTAILESIGDGVFAINAHGVIGVFNPAAQQISATSADEAIGKPYGEILHFELEKTGRVNDAFIRKALSGHVASMPVGMMLVRRDGKRIPVSDSAAPIHDASGAIVGAIVVFRDTSKEYELDKAKNEFVSLASHQLRTPLSAINWYSEMLLSGDAGKLGKDQHEYINEISEGSQRMSELVNSLLNVSRLEVGKLTNEPAPNNVQELIGDLEKEMQGQIEQRGIKVTDHVQKIPQVIADPKQLRMVVQNLLSNAVKYTSEKGAVDVTLRLAKPEDLAIAGLKGADPHWFFSVQDNGYGIPQDQQSKIFGKLFRADNVRKLDVEGTGLGLYIVKEVVEKMGGRVWFTSIESVGTTFYVVAPVITDKRSK
jgi:PAS domain S-box-containing protein